MNRIEQLYHDSSQVEHYARGYLDYLRELFSTLDTGAISAFIDVLLQAQRRGARFFLIGNGGSAATASHFANDLSIGSRSWTMPFRVTSLTDNTAIVTAIGNDYGYAEIFTLQLKTQMSPGDVVVAISASGNSPNVVNAIEYANARGGITVALTGFDGGQLGRIAQVGVHVPTDAREYGPVEDVHMVLAHLVGTFLMQIFHVQADHSD